MSYRYDPSPPTPYDFYPFESLRIKRNELLKNCDWVTLKCYSKGEPVTDEWKVYMQALRDLPANTTDPENPVWSTPPPSQSFNNSLPIY